MQDINEEGYKDIFIVNGKFEKIEEKLDIKSDEILNLDGYIVTSTFIDPHLHIDKAFTAKDRFSNEETLEESMKIMHTIKRYYSVKDVKERALKTIKDSAKYGVTKIRAHVDTDNLCNLIALEGCLLAKEEVKDIIDIQIVAFPQEVFF